MNLLEVRKLSVSYGLVSVVYELDLVVGEKEIVCLLGSNGAGKSSTLMAISGLVPGTSGEVIFRGDDIARTPSHEIARRGLLQVPEGRRVFPRMTVLENLHVAGAVSRSKRVRAERIDRCYELFPRLAERASQQAGSLSGGEQQMLAVGRALMAGPSLIMMDEPSLGLAPRLVETTFETIQRLRDDGIGVLLVEQNAAEALAVSDRAYVLENGRLVLSGPANDLRENPKVKEAYLGL